MRILLVDDEEVIRALCGRILTRMDCDVVLAGGVKEAMETMSVSDDLGLLITDMNLPDGDGTEVIGRFREKHPLMKVLVITGSISPGTGLERLSELGLSKKDCLRKPFGLAQFESAVRSCVGAR